MAVAAKCDRCGSFYDLYSIKGVRGHLVNDIALRYCNITKESFDMCPNCMMLFIDWMTIGAKKEVSPDGNSDQMR